MKAPRRAPAARRSTAPRSAASWISRWPRTVEEAFEEAGGLRDRRAGRQHRAPGASAARSATSSLGFVEQPRGGAGDQRRRPASSCNRAGSESRHVVAIARRRAERAESRRRRAMIAPRSWLRRLRRRDCARRRAGRGPPAPRCAASARQRCSTVPARACAVAQDVGHRRQAPRSSSVQSLVRRAPCSTGRDAGFGGARQIGDHRVAHEARQRAELGRLAQRPRSGGRRRPRAMVEP